MKINNIIYPAPVASDKETKIPDLKLKIGRSKPIGPGKTPIFSSADIGLNFSELPKLDRFYFSVTDDGTADSGEKAKEETAKKPIDTKVNWCPTKVNLYAAYDLRASAARDIIKTIWIVVVPKDFTIYQKDELMFDRMFKEIDANLKFTGDKDKPATGEISVDIINKMRSGLWGSRSTIEAGRSRGIKTIQKDMELKLGIKIGEEIAKWGCKEGYWKSFNFGELEEGGKPEIVCTEYEDELIEIKLIYDLDKENLTLIGFIGGKESGNRALNLPQKKLAGFLELLKDDVPSVITETNSKMKVADKGYYTTTNGEWVNTSGYLENDFNNKDAKARGIIAPSEVVSKIKMCTDQEQKQPEQVGINTEANTLTTESDYVSYYYIQEPFYQSKEDSAIKISLNTRLNKNITKIFYYNESEFSDENLISLYRYNDSEIENECHVNVLSKNNLNFNSSGGDFKTSDVEIIIPQDAVNSPGILSISKVNVTNCIIYYDSNISIKDVIGTINIWVNGKSDIKYLKDYIKSWLNSR